MAERGGFGCFQIIYVILVELLTFLEVNGISLDCANEEVVHIGLSVADGSMDYDALLAWIKEHQI